MYIRTELGLVIVAGCAHRGIVNIILHAKSLLETEKVHMVIGGTHLGPASEHQLSRNIDSLKELDVDWLGVSHCTGLRVSARLQAEFDHKFFNNSAGSDLRFPYGD